MNGRLSVAAWAVLLPVLLGALSGAGRAAEQTPAVAAARAEGSDGGRTPTLDDARKDFDAVKSMRNLGGEAKADLPRFSVPRMQTEGTSGTPAPNAKGGAATQAPAANWLLEAMEKKQSSRGFSPGAESRWERKAEPRDGHASDPRGEPKITPPRAEEQSRQNRMVPANPFTPYLGQWMTPHDYALLRPALKKSPTDDSLRFPDTPGDKGDSLQQPPGDTTAPAPGLFSPLSPTVPRGSRPTAKQTNPYLDLGAPSRPPLVGAAPTVTVAPPLPVAVPVQPVLGPASPPVQARIPDFVKPDNDEKYFKPLKRF